jgi:amicyanin
LRKLSNVIASAAVLALVACGSTSSAAAGPMRHTASPSPAMTGSPSTSPSTLPSGTPGVATTQVAISNYEFHPASIRVKQGSTVTWTQEDGDVHNVKFTGAGGVVSPVLRKGETFRHTFDTTGTYPYICSIHPYMHGTVVVTA